MMEISKSCSPEQALQARRLAEELGCIEAPTLEAAQALEASGKRAFVDHTNNGKDCDSEEEREDFRRTDCTVPGAFEAHLRRFGKA